MVREYEIDGIYDSIWRDLARATKDYQSEYRWLNLATAHPTRGCSVRTVVLREAIAQKKTVRVHTDLRAQKISEIEHCPLVTAHFHNRKKGIQIRITGRASIAPPDIQKSAWNILSQRQKSLYRADPTPGRVIQNVTSSELPVKGNFKHFCVIDIKAEEIDWLLVNRSSQLRARLICKCKKVISEWIAP